MVGQRSWNLCIETYLLDAIHGGKSILCFCDGEKTESGEQVEQV
jgi:prepilin-type processing-associated H-X9-DG protein